MEWITALRGTVVAVDTAPLIYFIEENPVYLPLLRPFFEAVDRGEFRVVTSILTLTEVLVLTCSLFGPRHRAPDTYHLVLFPVPSHVPSSSGNLSEVIFLRLDHALRVTRVLIPIASRISWSRAIATVWYSFSS